MSVLNVAEKNDAAKGIANFLSRSSAHRREGRSKYNKIYEFQYNLNGNDCQMIMTSVSGHLLNLAFPPEMKNWTAVNPLTLFDSSVSKICSENSLFIRKTLEELIRKCNMLVIWTDCDREGENIGMEIVDVCRNVKPNITVKRAKFSEITYQSITRAMNNLVDMDLKLSQAVDVRQELDLKTGAAFTRLQTIKLKNSFPDTLNNQVISYGSCQFPTLGFVVERYKNVENFQSEPFWKLELFYQKDNNNNDNSNNVNFIWERGKLFDENIVKCLYDNIRNDTNGSSLACVIDIVNKPKSKWRPFALDTVELEKLASRKLKINAKDTMTIAEKLYSQGYISYPRTETNIFPKEMNLIQLVEKQIEDQRWSEFASQLIESGVNPHNGKKSDKAHPPIHPLKSGTNLQGNEARIFELITRHFLACLSKNAEGHETKVTIECLSELLARELWNVVLIDQKMKTNNPYNTEQGEIFTATGLMILARNYLDVYIYDKWSDKELPIFEFGEVFKPTSVEIQSGVTTPPSLLTEADLITLMDKHGIGTDATHAEHIEKIKSRQYIGNTGPGNKFLVPSLLGMGLIEAYDCMGYYLGQPNLRADFEKDLQLICDGQKRPSEVLTFYIRAYREIFENVQRQSLKLGETVGKYLEEQPINNSNQTYNSISTTNTTTATTTDYNLTDVRNCPLCTEGRLRIRQTHSTNIWLLGCSRYPQCDYSIWFQNDITRVTVAKQHGQSVVCSNNHNNCPTGENVNKLALKTNNTNNPMLASALRNEEGDYVVCLFCDQSVLESVTTSGLRTRNPSSVSTTPQTCTNYNRTTTLSAVISPYQDLTHRNYHNDSNNLINNNISPDNEDIPMCKCGVSAVKKKVLKNNQNNGRYFFVCNNKVCNFFSWADGIGNLNTSTNTMDFQNQNQTFRPVNTSQTTHQNNTSVKCNCDMPAKKLTVQRETVNKGRQFYSCQTCKFFSWADEEPSGSNNMGYSRKRPVASADSSFSANSSGFSNFTSSENMWPPGPATSRSFTSGRSRPSGGSTLRKCSKCKTPGHTANKCPQRFD